MVHNMPGYIETESGNRFAIPVDPGQSGSSVADSSNPSRNSVMARLRSIENEASKMLEEAKKRYEYDTWYAQNHLPKEEVSRALAIAQQNYAHAVTNISNNLNHVRNQVSKIMEDEAKRSEKRELTPERIQQAEKEAMSPAHIEAARYMQNYWGAKIDPASGMMIKGEKGYSKQVGGFTESEAIKNDPMYKKQSDGTYTYTKTLTPAEAESIYKKKIAENMANIMYQKLFPYYQSEQQAAAVKQYLNKMLGVEQPKNAAVVASGIPEGDAQAAWVASQDPRYIEYLKGQAIQQSDAVGRRAMGMTTAAIDQAYDIAKKNKEGKDIWKYIQVGKDGVPYYQSRPGYIEPLDPSLIGKYVDENILKQKGVSSKYLTKTPSGFADEVERRATTPIVPNEYLASGYGNESNRITIPSGIPRDVITGLSGLQSGLAAVPAGVRASIATPGKMPEEYTSPYLNNDFAIPVDPNEYALDPFDIGSRYNYSAI